MREIVVLSGKGGTGKTSVTASLAQLFHQARPGSTVLADLDVDTPDLHILLDPQVKQSTPFVSGHEAVIDQERCTQCGICAGACRFEAIEERDDAYRVDPLRCEGCKVCVALCPEQAVEFNPRYCGDHFLSETRLGPMVHAQLFPGQENSGRLVTLIKQQAKDLAASRDASYVLCDGAPGIGCPVISSLAGANLALLVTEPTPSGLHDLVRVADLCAHFRMQTAVLVNKHDLSPDYTARIESFCEERGLELLGKLPHDPAVTRAMVKRQTVTEAGPSPVSQGLYAAFERLTAHPALTTLSTNKT